MNPWLLVGLVGAGLLWWQWREKKKQTDDPVQGPDLGSDPVIRPEAIELVDRVDAANAANLSAQEVAPQAVARAAAAAPKPTVPAVTTVEEAKKSSVLQTAADRSALEGINEGTIVEKTPSPLPDMGLRSILTGTMDIEGAPFLASTPGPEVLSAERIAAAPVVGDKTEEAAPLVDMPSTLSGGELPIMPGNIGAGFTDPALN